MTKVQPEFTYRVDDIPGPVAVMIDQLRLDRRNGGAECLRFTVTTTPRDFAAVASRTSVLEGAFMDSFMADPAVTDALTTAGMTRAWPAEKHTGPAGDPPSGWRSSSSFLIAGDWAMQLHRGGAYTYLKNEPRERLLERSHASWAQATAASAAIFGSRFTDVDVYATHDRWCEWFKGSVWDRSWLLIDRATSSVTLLTVTDLD